MYVWLYAGQLHLKSLGCSAYARPLSAARQCGDTRAPCLARFTFFLYTSSLNRHVTCSCREYISALTLMHGLGLKQSHCPVAS